MSKYYPVPTSLSSVHECTKYFNSPSSSKHRVYLFLDHLPWWNDLDQGILVSGLQPKMEGYTVSLRWGCLERAPEVLLLTLNSCSLCTDRDLWHFFSLLERLAQGKKFRTVRSCLTCTQYVENCWPIMVNNPERSWHYYVDITIHSLVGSNLQHMSKSTSLDVEGELSSMVSKWWTPDPEHFDLLLLSSPLWTKPGCSNTRLSELDLLHSTNQHKIDNI